MRATRRAFLGQTLAGLGGLLLSACAHNNTRSSSSRRAIILVHGSWHGAWCYSGIIPLLAAKGISGFALDLPGHGLLARFPQVYLQRPSDPSQFREAFSKEPSPLAGITLAHYVDSLTAAIDQLLAAGYGPLTLLGHSMGGVPITAAAERNASKLQKLIYLTAYMPVAGKIALHEDYRDTDSLVAKIFEKSGNDSSKLKVSRFDPRSPDRDFVKLVKDAFYGDVRDDEAEAAVNLLTPDDPLLPLLEPTGATRERWGKIPRSYIRCLQDRALTPKVQDRIIADADTFASNATEVRDLNTSHSPFLSRPQELADLIAALAA